MFVPRRGVKRFVIFFPGRAGGTYLASALDAHPEVLVKTEPLGLMREQGSAVQLDWVHHFYRGPMIRRHRAVALSTKLHDVLDPPGLADLLQTLDARVVLLDRRNDVKQAISIIRARRLKAVTGRWNRFSPDVELGPIEIDPHDFAMRLERSRARKIATGEYVATLGLPTLHLDYETLLITPTETFGRVFEFLGVAPVPVAGNTYKVTSDDLRDSVSNFDELRAHYVGTPYEQMFDEVLGV